MKTYKTGERLTVSQARDLIGVGKSGIQGGDFIYVTPGDIVEGALVSVVIVYDYDWYNMTRDHRYSMILVVIDGHRSATVHIGHCEPYGVSVAEQTFKLISNVGAKQ
jgi:hypothetical protein